MVLAQREQWVDLEPGKRVRVRRPDETEVLTLRRGNVTPEQWARCCVGWDGITEADLLGAAIGSSDLAEFSVELWVIVVRDHVEWLGKVADKVVEMISVHLAQKDSAGKA